jgi:hypothetical protein
LILSLTQGLFSKISNSSYLTGMQFEKAWRKVHGRRILNDPAANSKKIDEEPTNLEPDRFMSKGLEHNAVAVDGKSKIKFFLAAKKFTICLLAGIVGAMEPVFLEYQWHNSEYTLSHL